MSNLDDSVFEGFEEEELTPRQQPKGPQNRSFLIAVGIIAALTIVVLIVGVILFVVFRSGGAAAKQATAEAIIAANTATSVAATNVMATQFILMTPSSTPQPTSTTAPTATEVVALPTETPTASQVVEVTEAGEPTVDETARAAAAAGGAATATLESGVGGPPVGDAARTQTVAALLTQAASGNPTAAAGLTATTLPQSGFADQVGLPGLLGLALLLVAVIFLVRRLRLSASQ